MNIFLSLSLSLYIYIYIYIGVNSEPKGSHFACVECPYPESELQTDQVLIKTCYLSVDPYLVSVDNMQVQSL